MRVVANALLWTGTFLIATAANAIVPAVPRVIAGVDHISAVQLGETLSKFCDENDCVSKLAWHKYGDYVWNMNVKDMRPVSVGSGCVRDSSRVLCRDVGLLR